MSNDVIKVENISKLYRLGEVGTGTIAHDLNRWWARIRGKEDPFSKVGQLNDRTQAAGKGETVWAIKDICFDVTRGEVLGIIGKNGAGKSTLLKVLSRITSPTTGSIKIKGRVASLLEVGTGFHPEMTGRENVYLNGTILGMSRKEIDSKFKEIMDFAGCLKYADTPVKRYSSGMKVRLGFAVAAFLEPEILIVDEVLAVGDAEFQKKAIGKMQDISRGGQRTVLFVSHNMASVQQLCDSVIVIKNGVAGEKKNTQVAIEEYLLDSEDDLKDDHDYCNLNHYLNRQGTGFLRFSKIDFSQFLDAQNFTTNLKFFPGKLLAIRLRFFLKDIIFQSNAVSIDVAVQFFDQYEKKIFVVSTRHMGVKLDLVEGANSVLVKIHQLQLLPGRYKIGLWSSINGEVSDRVNDLIPFDVLEDDYYDSGKMLDSRHGYFFVDCDWKIISQSHIDEF